MQTRCKKARLKHTGTDTLTTTAVVVDHVQVAVFVSRESVQYWMRERRVRVNVDGERAHADSRTVSYTHLTLPTIYSV